MEADQAGNIREVCGVNNVTETPCYRWRSKFGGVDVLQATRLQEFEARNRS